jgi:pimeloyl-ACP methyl ester carboxylesterase
MSPRLSPEARHALYNQTLTHRIWTLATQNANPASDLVVCLERRRAIGFRYPEVTRSVVIHHGAKDTRVPLDNVRWLHGVMKRCELRILDDEGHGLMASASAMAAVLGEIAKEWEEWERIAQNKQRRKRSDAASTFSRGRSFHSRFVDASYREAASRDS